MNKCQNKKKILLLSANQYGYFIDHYYLSIELSRFCDVEVLSMNENRPHIEGKHDVKVVELQKLTKLKRALGFNNYLKQVADNSYDLVIATYFKGIAICAHELNRISENSYVDIRTVDVAKKGNVRLLSNILINLEHRFFSHCSVISEPVGNYLHLNKKRIIIPLGCNIIAHDRMQNNSSNINLLYVGTFVGRHIERTIEALSLLPKTILERINYNIVGDGTDSDLSEINKMIQYHSLYDNVHLHGYISSDKLLDIYMNSHIGISYIPINTIYNYQPPTKTLEYLAAGLPVVATKTAANIDIVDSSCGILVNDDPSSFAAGISNIVINIKNYDAEKIKDKMRNNTWEVVARNIFNLI